MGGIASLLERDATIPAKAANRNGAEPAKTTLFAGGPTQPQASIPAKAAQPTFAQI
jgi:hypothetical protein